MESPETLKEYARVMGSPGEGARTAGMLRSFWPVLVLVGLIGYVLGVALPPFGDPPRILAGFVLLVLAGAIVWSANHCRSSYGLFLKGARGEEEAARLLNFLPAGCYVFHSVQLDHSTGRGAGDFDHIVVTPGGVFVIETKNWSGEIDVMDGQIYVDGEASSFGPVEQVQESAQMLAEWFQEQQKVTPEIKRVLCFVTSHIASGPKQVDGVWVCDGQSLTEILLKDFKPGVGLDGVATRALNALQAQMKSSND
jgi:hypothetical protein